MSNKITTDMELNRQKISMQKQTGKNKHSKNKRAKILTI